MRFFDSVYFHQTTSLSPVRHTWKTSLIFFLSNIRGVIRIRNRLPGVFTAGELTYSTMVYKRTPLMKNTLGSQDSPVINTLWSLDSLVYYSPESFFCKPVLMLVRSTLRSRLPGVPIFTIGESRLHGVFIIRELRFHGVFITRESRLPGIFTTEKTRLDSVFTTGKSFWTPGVILLILSSIQKSLKGLSF
jgi:hypothetical protein